jgi:hypothetical protein
MKRRILSLLMPLLVPAALSEQHGDGALTGRHLC